MDEDDDDFIGAGVWDGTGTPTGTPSLPYTGMDFIWSSCFSSPVYLMKGSKISLGEYPGATTSVAYPVCISSSGGLSGPTGPIGVVIAWAESNMAPGLALTPNGIEGSLINEGQYYVYYTISVVPTMYVVGACVGGTQIMVVPRPLGD